MTSVLADAVTRRVSDPDPVNLAFGPRTDLLTVISMIETILGHPVERHHIDSRPGDVRHSQADGTRSSSSQPLSQSPWKTACARRLTGCERSTADVVPAGVRARRTRQHGVRAA